MKRYLWISVVGLVVLITVGAAVYWGRCHAAPLTRDEALRRAMDRVERFAKSYHVGTAALTVREADFEQDSNSWRVTFGNSDCVVSVIVDRCHGDEIGGSTGCPSR